LVFENKLLLNNSINQSVSKLIQQPKPQSKQNRYDCKPQTKLKRKLRDQIKNEHHRKVRLTNNISLLRKIYSRAKIDLKASVDYESAHKAIMDSCFHRHGRPQKERKYNILQKHLRFHYIPTLYWNTLFERVEIKPNERNKPYCISVKTLTAQIRRDLGLKRGDSFVWQETNRLGKVVKHFLDFDSSGLDDGFGDLERLVNFSIETSQKGYSMLSEFALKFSVDNYISVYRGNRNIVTSNTNSMIKAYLNDCAKFT
jgi:hypothetical protein